jgi:pSer/pThr/pTyr-binding forkhead associated (FHA) protein
LAEPAAAPLRPAPQPPAPAVSFAPSPSAASVAQHPAPSAAVTAPPPVLSAVSSSSRLVPSARLVLVGRDGNEGLAYPLGETTDVGRTEGVVLLGEDRYISPRHARIAFRTGTYFLRDLGSTNGIFFRIPFRGGLRSREPEAGGASGPRPMRQQGVEAGKEPAAGEGGGRGGRISSDSEQPLEDQDLFLVGQQVLRFEVVKDAEEGFGVASDNGTLLFGTPATPRFARLAQRTVEGVVRDVFNVRKAETVLGRESGDIVFPDDPFLSRRHAVLRIHGLEPRGNDQSGGQRRFTLSDLGSSNGTFLKIHAEIPLRHGDHFRIGQQLFRFDLEETKNGA